MLFFSDPHIRTAGVRGFFPGVRQRGGTEWLTKSFRELFEAIPMPDCILFGGDLAGEAAWIDKSLDFLRTIPSGPQSSRFAATGNSVAAGSPRNAGATFSPRPDFAFS